MQKDCSALCNSSQGMQNNDPSSCEKSEGILRDVCYSDIAKNNKDISICSNIQEASFVDSCYIGVAEATKDSSICDRIANDILKISCVDETK